MQTWLIYIRKSVVKDDIDLESPERQLHLCHTRLALLDQPHQVEIYQDLDRSGFNESGRPAWLDLKDQLSRPDVAGVVASSLDRLYRNVGEFLQFLTLLEQSGKALITAKENLDTSTHLGRFVVTILMALFEMESRLTSQRMTEMIAYKRQEQGRHWGPAPFGADRNDDGHLIPTTAVDPAGRHLHDALVELFRQYATGRHTYATLADALNAAGWQYHDRFGQFKPFDKQTCREILARWRLYRGDLPLGNPRKDQNIQWLAGGHQPIIPIELCDAVGHCLQRKNRPYKARQTNRIYLLSGILRCAECGQKLTGQKEGKNYYYRHAQFRHTCPQQRIPAPAIEQQMLEALIEVIQHPTLLADVSAGLQELAAPTGPDRATAEREQQLRRQIDRLEDIYITGDIGRNSYLAKRGKILTELAELDLDRRPPTNLATLLDDIAASMHLIIHATPPTQREILSTLFRRLTAAEGQIKTAVPQSWAQPFFHRCEIWAGWDSNPHTTRPVLLSWLTTDA